MKRKNTELELSQVRIPFLAFLELYNQNIPVGFPRASAAILRRFQAAHPTLFKQGDVWSIAQHRKRLMDWLSTHRDIS